MMPDNVALFATIILLLPMFYFLLAAPAFLLVKLDIAPVAKLLRAMFNGYFLTLASAAAIGTLAVAATAGAGCRHRPDRGAHGCVPPLVPAANGCRAWRQRCRRGRAPSATAALGRHAEQRGSTCRRRGQHSQYCRGAELTTQWPEGQFIRYQAPRAIKTTMVRTEAQMMVAGTVSQSGVIVASRTVILEAYASASARTMN